MAQLNFHNSFSSTSPRKPLPAVISKEKEAFQYWLPLYQNLPKTERFGLGQKIYQLFIEILGLSFSAAYLPPAPKMILLGKTIKRLDLLKFFLQIAWENKLLPTNKYSLLSGQLEEIGRMLGGWKKGLQSKTPAK